MKAALAAALVAALALPQVADAAWFSTASGAAGAAARRNDTTTPVVSVSGPSATVTWNGGIPAVAAYTVRRYDALAPGTGTVVCTTSASSCVEAAVPTAGAGTWKYTVTPAAVGAWTGLESPESLATQPVPLSVAFANGGGANGAGKPDKGDTVTVTFSQRLSVASLCGSWSGDAADQVVTGSGAVVVTITRPAQGNDVLTVSVPSACGGAGLRFGAVDLGARAFTPSAATYSGNGGNASKVQWFEATGTPHRLVVTLGALASGSVTAGESATATYVPDPAVVNLLGRPATGTATVTGRLF